jgi:four helix bundle protein
VKTQNIIVEKSYNVSLLVISFYKKLIESHEYVLSKQVLRSATSIGANVEEAITGNRGGILSQKWQLLQRSQRNKKILDPSIRK